MNLLTINDVLKKLQIKRTTFYYLRQCGAFPPASVNVTGTFKGMRWTEDDVDEYLQARQNFLEKKAR